MVLHLASGCGHLAIGRLLLDREKLMGDNKVNDQKILEAISQICGKP